PGLVDAIAASLPGASWQRCRTHFVRNLQTRVPKSAQSLVATLVRSIFAQPDTDSVLEQHQRVCDQLPDRYPAAGAMVNDRARHTPLTPTSSPQSRPHSHHENDATSHTTLTDVTPVPPPRDPPAGFEPAHDLGPKPTALVL